MKKKLWLSICLMPSLISLQNICVAGSDPFLAYSMREAERRTKISQSMDREVATLGGITRLVGAVYDAQRNDVILVGQVVPGETSVNLDDLVVALRSRFLHDKWPEVSIEKSSEATSSATQMVRYEGGIEQTHFGKCFFEADLILKKISLGLLPTEIWGVNSYFDMAVEQRMNNPQENILSTRFWFNPVKRYSVSIRPRVVALNNLRIRVKAQLESAKSGIDGSVGQTNMRNEVADRFAQLINDVYGDLCAAYPEVAALKSLMDLIAIAKGVEDLDIESAVTYWIREYPVEYVTTPLDYPLLKRESKIPYGNKTFVFQVDGGVVASASMSRLTEEGDITVIRDLVYMSRPDRPALTWRVPLDGWTIPGYESADYEITHEGENVALSENSTCGCTIGERLFTPGLVDSISPVVNIPKPSTRGWSYTDSDFHVAQHISTSKYSRGVGGVMLQSTARVDGALQAQVDLNSGNFSLVVDGQNARLDPKTFRRFVTALWSVYYSNQDPGISIDPIAPGVNKHMVRYIGKVVNTDIGRVMREADYLMKIWSVGTARPDIHGFRNPDDISGRRGYFYYGASRFWFVPQDMMFKRTDDMLLFENGRMTVQTEYLFDNSTGMKADPANEEFASFLTDRYSDFAAKYPVLQELFDYAKMVSLAKYLKESGVPLYWFLMANKDLVLTEDSPGTVEALAKGSDYFKNLRIEGGVKLGVRGNYVYDSEAMKAIQEAAIRYANSTVTNTTDNYKVTEIPAGTQPFSFDLCGHGYSVVPQHSLTSGKDRRGIRYQTDIALRSRGFKLTKKSWELLKHDVTRHAFAKRWNPLVESKAELEREGKRLYQETFMHAEEQVADDLKNLKILIGEKFDSEKTFVRVVEKILQATSDPNILLLAKKHAYYQTDLEIVRFFNPQLKHNGPFGQGWHLLIPYQIKPHGIAKRDFLNIRIPEKMTVENLITGEQEVLAFSTDRYVAAGYVPSEIESSQVVGLFIMSDASYRLVDKLGNEFCFNQAGYLTDMSFSPEHHIHIEYVRTFTKVFQQSPYRIEPVGDERTQFLNAKIPTGIKVKDLVNDSSEVLFFSDDDTFAGYIPKDKDGSRFKTLVLMSDASLRLFDKMGNEIAFRSNGQFDCFAVSSEEPLVASISAGPYKVDFTYTIDGTGRVLLAGAQLLETGKTEPLCVLHYEYDYQGRLCRAERTTTEAVGFIEEEQKIVLAQQ